MSKKKKQLQHTISNTTIHKQFPNMHSFLHVEKGSLQDREIKKPKRAEL